jgi:hypothetical protein
MVDRTGLKEAVDLLTTKGEFLNRISRHNAYEFAVAVADVAAAARAVVEAPEAPRCRIHDADMVRNPHIGGEPVYDECWRQIWDETAVNELCRWSSVFLVPAEETL